MTGMPPVTTRLRPARPDEHELLARWRSEPASEFEELQGAPDGRRPDARPAVGPASLGELVITDGADVPIGTVGWHQVLYGPNQGSVSLNIGISVRPPARGQGHGSRAQRMLADYLFVTFAVHRVEASTDVTNLAEQRSLERAGFVREGILRGAQWRAGRHHDLVSYSRLRTDA